MNRPQPAQIRSKERVDTIFEATRVLLREGGFERCTVAGIAARANISPASLYRYFPDATAIIRALAEESLDQVHQGFALLLQDITSRETLEPVMKLALDAYIEHFTSDRAMRELWFGTLADRELIALNVADSRRNGALIASKLAPFVNVDVATLESRWFLLSHMIGAAIGLMLEVPAEEARILRTQLDQLLQSVSSDIR